MVYIMQMGVEWGATFVELNTSARCSSFTGQVQLPQVRIFILMRQLPVPYELL
jgi:hypothetical protein